MPVVTEVVCRSLGMLKQYSVKLFYDSIVFVQGITASERKEAPLSYLCGMLEANVRKKSIPIKSLNVRFVGEAMDMETVKTGNFVTLARSEKIIIDESWVHHTEGGQLMRGKHRLPFRFMLTAGTPESVKCLIGERSYFIEVSVVENDRPPLKVFRKRVDIVRRPSDSSLMHLTCTSIVQEVYDDISCQILMTPKLIQSNETMVIAVKIRKHNNFPIESVLKLVNVEMALIQKMIIPGELRINSKFPIYKIIKKMKSLHHKQIEITGDGDFEETYSLKLSELSNQHITPYNSNNGDNDLQEQSNGMALIHLVQFNCHFLVHCKSFRDHSKIEQPKPIRHQVSLTSRVHLLHPKVGDYEHPPVYSAGDGDLSYNTRSSVWYHSNGRSENDFSPPYSSKV